MMIGFYKSHDAHILLRLSLIENIFDSFRQSYAYYREHQQLRPFYSGRSS